MAEMIMGLSDTGDIIYKVIQDDGKSVSISLSPGQADTLVRLTLQALSLIRQNQQIVRIR